MKKKIIGLLGIVMSAALIAGCNGSANAVSSVDDQQSVIIEETPSPEPVVEEPAVVEEPSSPEPVVEEPEVGDPALKALEVDEPFASANGLLCLYRNGALYSLGPYVPAQTTYDYGIGHVENGRSALFFKRSGELYTYGDVLDVVLQEGDELRDYSGYHNIYSLASLESYTVCLWEDNDCTGFFCYLDDQNPVWLRDIDVEIKDQDGNMADRRNMQKYAVYTVEWYEGVQYHSQELCAYCKIYDFADENYTLDEELTKSGYALVDWSALPSGTYCSNSIPIYVQ